MKRKPKTVQMDSLKDLLGIRRIDRVPSVQIREFCGEIKGEGEGIDEGILRLFGHTERIGNERIGKTVHVEEYVGSGLVWRLRNGWIDSVNECLKKRGLNVG